MGTESVLCAGLTSSDIFSIKYDLFYISACAGDKHQLSSAWKIVSVISSPWTLLVLWKIKTMREKDNYLNIYILVEMIPIFRSTQFLAICISTNADLPKAQASHPRTLCLGEDVSDLYKSLWFAFHFFSFWVSPESGSCMGTSFPTETSE